MEASICIQLLYCTHTFSSFKDDGDESFNDNEDGNGSKDNFREQDIYLPIANVARIMKNAIPQTGKVLLCIRRVYSASFDYISC